ncbi:hypothetical protein KP509_27G035900 [Ceratopteris richardii]|uniref:Uncharacterized protein n=1 Tax=Ceratopteris richardii TaxID=49495 RepID=A0A8T2RI03_CERRI|nr:hypothetical protein KP509_27G035900 [Ceratopteris richardii]
MALVITSHTNFQGSMVRHAPYATDRWQQRNAFLCLSDRRRNRSIKLQANALFSPQDDPIVKEALKEPVAFLGGVFAGFLRLDLNEDPLREWIANTSQAAGIQDEVEEVEEEETPAEITIE